MYRRACRQAYQLCQHGHAQHTRPWRRPRRSWGPSPAGRSRVSDRPVRLEPWADATAPWRCLSVVSVGAVLRQRSGFWGSSHQTRLSVSVYPARSARVRGAVRHPPSSSLPGATAPWRRQSPLAPGRGHRRGV